MIKEHQPFYREYMGKTFNFIVQSIVFKGIKDTQCGFKAFTAEAAKDIFSKAKIDGFGFDVEILYLALKAGYRIKEVPVEWYNDKRSTVNPISDSWKMLLDAIRVRKLHR
jgi:dolichyl-phosphate beta-glucosyltransferase